MFICICAAFGPALYCRLINSVIQDISGSLSNIDVNIDNITLHAARPAGTTTFSCRPPHERLRSKGPYRGTARKMSR
ncbi:hypothetical protein HD806DRAFT_485363 [Xylariaceae sp. AK1471]|nr:hypothetical protein HD806DRAFT_485363 [Xylariaceae sp. AK1471]